MKIKKYTAKDFKEGKRLVLEELGEDAVILSNRAFKDSETGEDRIEIVAALDEAVAKPQQVQPKESRDLPVSNIRQITKAVGTHSNELILSELDTLKNMISEIGDSIKFRNTAAMGSSVSKLYKRMRSLEIPDDQALRIVNRISAIVGLNDYQEAIYEARKILLEGLEIGKPLQKSVKSRLVMFIGTTGSGKTASLVKLAIISKIVLNANSLIVSADTYKVGASEQLETFASIAAIPFRSSFSNDDLTNIIKENSGKDFIFLDTTGVSQKDNEQVEQIIETIKLLNPDLVFLTLPATISSLTANSVLSAVKSIAVDSIILTKTDESESIGSLIQVIKSFKLPISYVTTGVKIPEDIQPADRIILGKLAISE